MSNSYLASQCMLQASVMSSFEKLMQWALKNEAVLAGNTSSLAAAALLLVSQAYQVTITNLLRPISHHCTHVTRLICAIGFVITSKCPNLEHQM